MTCRSGFLPLLLVGCLIFVLVTVTSTLGLGGAIATSTVRVPSSTAAVKQDPASSATLQENQSSSTLATIRDLGLNLVSETIGIIVTVGIIDQIIKRREATRWKPAKGLMCSDLLELCDRLLFWLVPAEFRIPLPHVYRFGSAGARTTFELSDIQQLSKVSEIVSGEVEARQEFTATIVNSTRQQLEYVLRFSSFIMEPDLFHMLLRLNSALDDLNLIEYDLQNGVSVQERQDYGELVLQAIQRGLALREWLLNQATEAEAV